MANNTISGTLTASGFVGPVTGDVVGDIIGAQTAPAATAYAADGAVGPGVSVALLSKGTAGAYTLAVPGAYGIELNIIATSAAAHVVTVTGMDGGNTLTFGGAIGDNITLFARTAAAWSVKSSVNVTASTV